MKNYLPEDWCIQITKENKETVRNFIKLPDFLFSTGAWYGYSKEYGWDGSCNRSNIPGEEITFEEFKQLVLNKEIFYEIY